MKEIIDSFHDYYNGKNSDEINYLSKNKYLTEEEITK